jgi:hypothetical protein
LTKERTNAKSSETKDEREGMQKLQKKKNKNVPITDRATPISTTLRMPGRHLAQKMLTFCTCRDLAKKKKNSTPFRNKPNRGDLAEISTIYHFWTNSTSFFNEKI